MIRLLMVEDSPTQARSLSFVLEEAGFTVTAVLSAEEGFATLQIKPFDLVLTDLILPGESGFDLCRRIKADPQFGHLPVVVITSQADPINVLRGLEAGADGFMTKDRTPREIIGRLRRTLDYSGHELENGQAPVVFLDCQFEITCRREQLLGVLLSAFEDVVHLNQEYRSTEAALRKANAQLREAVRSEQEAYRQLEAAQSRLVQAEKLSSLGQMVAGMAHEINNPLAVVHANLVVLQRDTQGLREVLDLFRQGEHLLATQHPDLAGRIRERTEAVDLPYILENCPGLLDRSCLSLKRIEDIVQNLRRFARLDESELKEVNLNDGIRLALDFLQARARDQQVALHAELGNLPPVTCYPAKVNQAVLNLVTNALDACRTGSQVTVRTLASAENVEIHVLDNGQGIDSTIRDRIFDPFFTTKPPGQGTGLGLSISYGIAQDHGGTITFESVVGQGSHFVLSLPRSLPRQSLHKNILASFPDL